MNVKKQWMERMIWQETFKTSFKKKEKKVPWANLRNFITKELLSLYSKHFQHAMANILTRHECGLENEISVQFTLINIINTSIDRKCTDIFDLYSEKVLYYFYALLFKWSLKELHVLSGGVKIAMKIEKNIHKNIKEKYSLAK